MGEEMAGKKARCKCGQIITIPVAAQPAPAPPATISVQCSACGRKYNAKPSMAGTITMCSCGETLSIPEPSAPAPQRRPVAPAPTRKPESPARKPEAPARRPEAAPRKPQPTAQAPKPKPSQSDPFGDLGSPTAAGFDDPMPSAGSNSLFDDLLAGPAMSAAPQASPLGPAPVAPRRKTQSNKNVVLYSAIAGGSVLALGLIVVLGLTLAGGGDTKPAPAPAKQADGPLGWASWCIPPNANGLVSINLAKVGGSDVGRLLQTFAKTASYPGGAPKAGTPSPAELVQLLQSGAECHCALSKGNEAILALRTKADMSLEDAAATRFGSTAQAEQPPSGQGETINGVPCLPMSGSKVLVAKLAPNTFCATANKEDLRAAIMRWTQGGVFSVGEPLSHAWQLAKGDIRVAMLKGGESKMQSSLPIPGFGPTGAGAPSSQPDWVSIGITTDANLGLQSTIGFSKDADAKTSIDGFKGMLQMLDVQAGAMDSQMAKMPPAAQAQMKAMKEALKLLHVLKFSQDDKLVQIAGTWPVKDLEGLIQQAEATQKQGAPAAVQPSTK